MLYDSLCIMEHGPIRAVFFDAHDTLIYAPLSPPDIFVRVCADAGVAVPLSEVEAAYPDPDELEAEREGRQAEDEDSFWLRFNRRLLSELGLEDPEGSLAHALVEGFQQPRWWRPFSDARSTLEGLRRDGYRLGVIANARHLVTGRLERADLATCFETITYSEEAGVPKPDPRIFQIAMDRVGCRPEESLHIGDRPQEDVAGARAAGMRPMLLDRLDRHPEVDCERLETLSALLDHLPAGDL